MLNHSTIDFNKISQVLTDTLEVVKAEHDLSNTALQQLEYAQDELQRAMSFSLSFQHKQRGLLFQILGPDTRQVFTFSIDTILYYDKMSDVLLFTTNTEGYYAKWITIFIV